MFLREKQTVIFQLNWNKFVFNINEEINEIIIFVKSNLINGLIGFDRRRENLFISSLTGLIVYKMNFLLNIYYPKYKWFFRTEY